MRISCKMLFLLCLIYISDLAYSSAEPALQISQLPVDGLLLNKGWKYKAGDNKQWANPDWNDSNWQHIDPTQDIHDLPPLWETHTGWFRLRFTLDSTLQKESLALRVEQTGASEIYLDGRLIGNYGRIGDRETGVQGASLPFGEFISLQPDSRPEHVLAVRFALQKGIPYINFVGRYNPTLALTAMEMKSVTKFIRSNVYFLDYVKSSLFFILALLHLVLFLFSPERKANLYFFIFSLLSTFNNLVHPITYQHIEQLDVKMYLFIASFLLYTSAYLFFLMATYAVFKHPKGMIFKAIVALYFLNIILFLVYYNVGWAAGLIVYPIVVFLESARIAVLADAKKIQGARVVIYGALAFLILYPLSEVFIFNILPSGPNGLFAHLTFNLAILSMPVSLSIFLATEASFTSRSLAAKLVEVQQLSEKTIFQEQEKRKLQELDDLKSRFFANISHEFRTPLSLIRGTVEKLRKKDHAADERQPDYQTIDRSAGRLLQMINQLLDLSRLEAGKLSLNLQRGDVSEQLKILGGSFASLFESKGITYRYTVPLQPVWVHLDCEKLEQIVNNLLSNAAKFTQAKGQVSFTATIQMYGSRTCSLQILVQDTGIGIPAGQLPRIFDRFYQADSSLTRHYEGTGIGLALVRELIDLHGGRVEVQSQEGRGSTFSLQIPYTLAEATATEQVILAETGRQTEMPVAAEHAPVALAGGESLAAALLNKKASPCQILVVEDNTDLRRFIAAYLSERFGVKQAEDGLDGYQKAVELLPDVIISDIMMPGLDGVSMCRKLKEDQRTSHIPVILLTAKADAQSKLSSLETGADDYLTKPFSAEELLLRVNNLILGRQKLKEKFSKSLSLQPSEIVVSSADEQFLQKALAVMEENMGNPDFDVDAFSREIGMSRAHLNRKLTALVDQSPNEFIRVMRLKRAAQLLQRQKYNVGEVAFMVGFSNPNYFTKCFRDYYRVAPSEYVLSGTTTEENNI
jgi:signal transduction histidine kinase/DNA-binding response OmpR family regulator